MKVNKNDFKIQGPFKLWTIENFPFIEADFDAITNYQLYSKIVEYLKQIAENQTELNNNYNELITAFNSLVGYVDNYFENLDVQEEINNKLDEMVESGEFEQIINEFFNDFRQEFTNELNNYENRINNHIDNYESSVNTQINNQNNAIESEFAVQNATLESFQNQIQNVLSGSPLVASDVSEMTNTGRIYVNTTDGKWYYYDGDSWEIGGTYQSTGLGEGSVKLSNLDSGLQEGLVARTGTSGTITSVGAIYTGNVGATVTLTTLSSYSCGELSVVAGDLVAVNFVNYDTNYGANPCVMVVDSSNKILVRYGISDFTESVDGRTLPKNTLLEMPSNAYKVLFNKRNTSATLGTSVNNPNFCPVKITSYNYCDKRLDAILVGKKYISSSETLDGIYSLLSWDFQFSNYKTKVYSVESLSKIHIKTTIPEVNYMTLALFTDSNDYVIGYAKPVGSSTIGRQSVDMDVTVPSFATKMYICYNPSVNTPEVYLLTASNDINNKNISVDYSDGVLTLTSNLLNNNIKFENYGGNNLFMIKSYKINGDTTSISTDMTPAPYIVEATTNANGDRVSEGFTGGNHGWNNTGSGSTATAEQVSLLFYADNDSFISGSISCDEFTIVETNRVQATNTCIEIGGGRNVLEEKIVFKYDGRNLKVTTTITPLESIKIKTYYGFQMVGSNFKYYAKKIQSTPSGLTTKPSLITSSSNISMTLNNGGLGDYDYNHNTYAVTYQSKAYYSPIYNNTSTFTSDDVLWLSGEYIFDNI